MIESKQATAAPRDVQAVAKDNEEAERSLGRAVAIALPVAGLVAAGVVGVVAGVGSALLVVAAATLLGTISLLWASVRTLSGDAPLSSAIESVAVRRIGVDALGEQKRRVLRALKDLEAERSLGKIDDDDYVELVARYRAEAKSVLREIDMQVEPMRSEAEKLAHAYLVKQGLRDVENEEAPAVARARGENMSDTESTAVRAKCAKCGVSNEADAAFCKKCGAPIAGAAEASDADA
jgi:hypothetical protein